MRTDVISEYKGLAFLQGLSSNWGWWTAGSRWALETDKKTGEVYALDLLTGERGLIEGLPGSVWNETLRLSPDGKKLLISRTGAVSELGIVDFEQQRYVSFSVEYGGDIDRISGCEWIGNDRFAITVDNAEREDLYHTHPHHYLIYRFLA